MVRRARRRRRRVHRLLPRPRVPGRGGGRRRVRPPAAAGASSGWSCCRAAASRGPARRAAVAARGRPLDHRARRLVHAELQRELPARAGARRGGRAAGRRRARALRRRRGHRRRRGRGARPRTGTRPALRAHRAARADASPRRSARSPRRPGCPCASCRSRPRLTPPGGRRGAATRCWLTRYLFTEVLDGRNAQPDGRRPARARPRAARLHRLRPLGRRGGAWRTYRPPAHAREPGHRGAVHVHPHRGRCAQRRVVGPPGPGAAPMCTGRPGSPTGSTPRPPRPSPSTTAIGDDDHAGSGSSFFADSFARSAFSSAVSSARAGPGELEREDRQRHRDHGQRRSRQDEHRQAGEQQREAGDA